jgi:hypothetical protein
MIKLDPLDKAAECARAIEITADPERRLVLDSLRNVWLALGSEPSFLTRTECAAELSTIAQIHQELMALYRNAMH